MDTNGPQGHDARGNAETHKLGHRELQAHTGQDVARTRQRRQRNQDSATQKSMRARYD